MLRVLEKDKIEGKRIVVRVDFNVAVEGGEVTDDFRIRATLPTLRFLRDNGARTIVLLAHRGRPKGTKDPSLSLAPVAEHLKKLWNGGIQFSPECVGGAAEGATLSMRPGELLLMENLRFHGGEEKNDPAFARLLARLGELYVGDAFGDAHRAHASISTLPELIPSAAGLLMQREVETLAKLKDAPQEPFVVFMGGAKAEDKIPLIEKFLPKVSAMCFGGVLANTLLKIRGVAIGKSLVDDSVPERLRAIALAEDKIHLPGDVVVSSDKSGAKPVRVCRIDDIADEELILDIGPKTRQLFGNVASGAKTVFWNGPMGLAEVQAFRAGTDELARALANVKGLSILGGGDTTRYPIELGLTDKMGFISTGGGAMLEYLSGAVLPGLTALGG